MQKTSISDIIRTYCIDRNLTVGEIDSVKEFVFKRLGAPVIREVINTSLEFKVLLKVFKRKLIVIFIVGALLELCLASLILLFPYSVVKIMVALGTFIICYMAFRLVKIELQKLESNSIELTIESLIDDWIKYKKVSNESAIV